MSDLSEQDHNAESSDSDDHDDTTTGGETHGDDSPISGDEHPDGIVGPERETPADAVPDDVQTAEDLADSGVDLGDPTGAAPGFVISYDGDELVVDVDGVEDEADEFEPTIDGMSERQLNQLAVRVAERRASLSNRPYRPFEHVDKESLLVLANQLRAELAYR